MGGAARLAACGAAYLLWLSSLSLPLPSALALRSGGTSSCSSSRARASASASAAPRRRRGSLSMASGKGKGDMEYCTLGDSDLRVSKMGLGCMTFGQSVDRATAHELLSVAVDEYGVNFVDTSEDYPFPTDTDEPVADRILGSWLKRRPRDSVVLATKVCGRSNFVDWIRSGGATTELSPAQIRESVESSLLRLGTDHIDLLQLSWPDRYVGEIAEDTYCYDRAKLWEPHGIEEQLMELQDLVEEGKIRHIGVADETPYGIMKFSEHAEWDELPKILSTQQPYNLLARNRVEIGMVEVCAPRNCDVSLIAHTPLAGGALTGKYQGQTIVAQDRSARLNRFNGFQARYLNENCQGAVARYTEVAERHGMSLTSMSLAWVYSRPHVAVTMIGATNEDQLRENLEARSITLSEEAQEDIYSVYKDFREPALGRTVA